jgi:hypothetical protein
VTARVPASETWTLQAVDYRGGTVGELDINAECDDSRGGIITVYRFPAGWRTPLHLNLTTKMERALLRVAREAVELGMIA